MGLFVIIREKQRYKLMSKEPSKNELSNVDIALFALFKAGGVTKTIHTEEVAWEAYQLAKERFSWRLPQFIEKGFPDKTPVRYALETAKKKESGNLVTGRAGGDINRAELEGWRFTPKGSEWIKRNEGRISQGLMHTVPQIRRLEAEHFIRQLKSDRAFEIYLKNHSLDEVSSYMFIDMLACTPDASREIIKQKLDQLLTTANLVDDKEINTFLDECAKKFSKYFPK
jgi:hypothetical protein